MSAWTSLASRDDFFFFGGRIDQHLSDAIEMVGFLLGKHPLDDYWTCILRKFHT